MKVENYSVKDIAQVSDYLIRNLIKANISYVFIKSNEIHYNDKIIRLHYDPTKTNNDDRTLLLKILKETLEISESLKIIDNINISKNNYYENQEKILKISYKRNYE